MPGSRTEVLIAGFGGQGIILAGVILGRAIALYEGRNAIQIQSYGPEARGGACRSEVVISDEEIDYPMVTKPDVFVAMSQEAFDRYIGRLKADGVLIADSSLVRFDEAKVRSRSYRVPATLAADELGRRVVANVVMLGALGGITGLASRESLRRSVMDMAPKGTEELNLKALERGFEIAEGLRGG
jgi:2-oxoglutarate ferredoxin oxidoreductase subunit gamma